MVEDNPDLDAVFQALGDPTRRAMLARLGEGETSVSELAAPFAMSLAGASKHVGVLERAGLVSKRKAGRQTLLRLEARRLREAGAWLSRMSVFWTGALDALDTALREEPSDD